MLTVLLNSRSGGSSKIDERRLVKLFDAEGVQIRIVPLTPGQESAIISEAVASADAAVVAAGGDGTVSSVAGTLAGGRVALGVLPLGTLNHFARDLHIPMDPVHAVKTIAASHVVKVDMGFVNDRAFINNSSIGAYPGIVEIREELRRQGRNKWIALAAATLKVLQRDADVSVRVEADGRRTITRTPFLFVGNNEYTIEGIHLGERTRVDAGQIFAYLAPRLHTRELPKLFLWAVLGRARRHREFATFAAGEMWIETPQSRSVRVATDGEITMLRTPLHYRTAPGALRVIVPAG